MALGVARDILGEQAPPKLHLNLNNSRAFSNYHLRVRPLPSTPYHLPQLHIIDPMHLRIHTVRSRAIFVTCGDKHSYRIFLSYLARNKNSACKESCIFTFRTALRFELTRFTPVTYRGKRVTKHLNPGS